MDMDSLQKIIEMHIKECDNRDERNVKSIDKIETMFKGIWDAHDEMRKVVTNLQIRAGLALGGLIVIGKFVDYYLALGHK
jgi:hypothetical protein